MKKIRRWFVLPVLGVVAILIIVGRDRLRYQTLAWLVLHENTPGEFTMHELVDTSRDQGAILNKLWNTGHLAQREFVLSYVRDNAYTVAMPKLWPQVRPIAIEAAFYGDFEIQQAAMTALEYLKDPDVISIAMTLVNDVDPGVRSLGTSVLLHTGDKKFVPLFVRLLDDPDHAVRVNAAGALTTLNDGEVKIDYDFNDLNSGQAAVDYWKKWWLDHQKEYADSALPRIASVSIMTMGPAPDFNLPDLQGNRVSIKDLRGKPVLLVFWATWCKPCVKEIPHIAEFQKKHPDDVTILGISVDNLKDAETGKTHVSGSDAELSDRVGQFAKDQQMSYRILMDNDGEALGRYSGGDLPVAIWVDSNGIMRRRFLGSRSSDCLERMLQATLQPLDAKGS